MFLWIERERAGVFGENFIWVERKFYGLQKRFDRFFL